MTLKPNVVIIVSFVKVRSMLEVKVKENEPFEISLRRFRRVCEKAGVLAELRKREFYEKPTAVRKRKETAAAKRHQKYALMLSRPQTRRRR